MVYRSYGKKIDVKVSALGMGTMRLPTQPDGTVDGPQAIELMEAAFDAGINYADTAFPYHAETSEGFLAEALNNGWRDKVYIADKLPIWNVQKYEDQTPLFNTQLKRLQTERIDFYLLHTLNKNYWKTVQVAKSIRWIDELKKSGRIRYAGFSFHDDFDLFKTIIDAYDWDFCQIQYNYAYPHTQAGMRGLHYAASKGIGVAVMEPLLGGFLCDAKLPPAAIQIFKDAGLDPVATALRWLWNQPEVGTVLSGMSSRAQLDENLKTASTASSGGLSAVEKEVIEKVCSVFRTSVEIPCTACGYCLKYCPVGVNIPEMFALYTAHTLAQGKNHLQKVLYTCMQPNERADACITCEQCLSHCPQNLPIPHHLKTVAKTFA
ncbi:MAG: aldo/keto reductase [bacterium]